MLCSPHTPSFLKGTGMTATSIVPKPYDRATGIPQSYENSANVIIYFLFCCLLILLAWWLCFDWRRSWVLPVLSLPTSHHLYPKLPLHCLNLLLPQWSEKFFLILLCLLTTLLLPPLSSDKTTNEHLSLLKGWLSFMGTCSPMQAPISFEAIRSQEQPVWVSNRLQFCPIKMQNARLQSVENS